MPKNEPIAETLCFITVVFPMPDLAKAVKIKEDIDAVLAGLSKVKSELRITTVKNDGGMGHETGLS